MSAHAVLAPSNAPQWGNCSGSLSMQAHAPDIEHPRTRSGWASHWVVSECLTAWLQVENGCPSASEWLGGEAPNGVIIDEEMVEGAQVFIDHALKLAQEHGALGKMWVEHRVAMPNIHAENWGTLDLCFPLFTYSDLRVTGGTLYLIDYKYGHRERKAFGDLQLVDYVAGIVAKFNIGVDIEVVIQVVQPFSYSSGGAVSEWRTRLSELQPYFNQLAAKAYEALNNPTLSAGPWCRDCKAITRCSVARNSSYSLIDYVNEPIEIDTLNTSDLAVERAILSRGMKTTKARLDAIEEEIKYRLAKGETGSGLALESSYGDLGWTIPAEQAIAFAGQLGVDAAKVKALTPTQTIAAASVEMRPILKQALKAVTNRPTRGLKIINQADSKTALAFKRN